MVASAILWFKLDLRLADNLALHAAIDSCKRIVPVYIWEPGAAGAWQPGRASRWWLHHSLAELEQRLLQYGARLILRQGAAAPVLAELAHTAGAEVVFCNRDAPPQAQEQNNGVNRMLQTQRIELREFPGMLLSDPGSLLNSQGAPYQVFTAYYNALQRRHAPAFTAASAAPQKPEAVALWLSGHKHQLELPQKLLQSCASLQLDDLHLLQAMAGPDRLREAWTPGEAAAHKLVQRLTAETAWQYKDRRDRLDLAGTSRLSPYLHFGEITPGQVWRALQSRLHDTAAAREADSAHAFLRQIIWREFAHYILHHFPHTATEPLRGGFSEFPWIEDKSALACWESGTTGYPVVDAAMQQLAQTGWMHNRARMIVASFLTKHLLVPWQAGARWFWDMLVDADLANNSFGWQWSAGCGADAAPYYRIFNPVLQGQKFDPDGAYVRRYLPQLTGLPASNIHEPWAAPSTILAAAGVRLGENYPWPCVEHKTARHRALAAFSTLSRRVP